jgi:hypothetical protein
LYTEEKWGTVEKSKKIFTEKEIKGKPLITYDEGYSGT